MSQKLVIDGAAVPDPDGTFIFGSGAWRSAVEIPAVDQDFYALKNVPHGQLREILYFGKTSDTHRRCFSSIKIIRINDNLFLGVRPILRL